MNPELGWKLSVTGALRAHFYQPDKTSRPGTDWAVELSLGNIKSKVLVRSYADDLVGKSIEEETHCVLKFVATLLESGWSPSQYEGKSGELIYKPAAILTAPSPSKKSWWRFK